MTFPRRRRFLPARQVVGPKGCLALWDDLTRHPAGYPRGGQPRNIPELVAALLVFVLFATIGALGGRQ